MLKTVMLAGSVTALLAVGFLPLHAGPAKAEQITCREAAKLEYPKNLMKRFAAKRACKVAWKAHKLNPQPLPPKA